MTNIETSEQESSHTFHLRAFAFEGEGGNLAGVTIDLNEEMTDEDRQSLATKLGYSESAFVLPSKSADFKVLFYTPTKRVAMCGHATIATWYQLYALKLKGSGIWTQEIVKEDGSSEILSITIDEDGIVYTELPSPLFKENIDKHTIASMLHISDEAVVSDNALKPEVVNTGFDDVMIPIKELKDFDGILFENLSEEEIRTFQEQNRVEGVHIFCLETDDDRFVAMAKNTDPINGIFPYDNATGTSNGALLCYLIKHGVVNATQAQQGVWVKQVGLGGAVSRVIVKAEMDNQQIAKVLVGGAVVSK